MSEKRYLARSTAIASRAMGDELMIMSATNSTLFTLNEIAMLIWEAADGATPLEDIVTGRICAEYDVKPEVAMTEAEKLVAVFARTLQYSYLFGILPALMIGAVDDILFHVRRIGWVARMLIVGVIGFIATELLYGSRGPDSGVTQFILYGLVGFIPATISSWLAHKVETPASMASRSDVSRTNARRLSLSCPRNHGDCSPLRSAACAGRRRMAVLMSSSAILASMLCAISVTPSM